MDMKEKDRTKEYDHCINCIIEENQINLDEILLTKNGESITVADFIMKTKYMSPWHRRLINNFRDIKEVHGDVKAYMRRYIEEKVNDGFKFKGQSGEESKSR